MPHTIRTLNFRTDCELIRHTGLVERKEAYTTIRSPNNPTYYWGNFILFDTPPTKGVFKEWTQTFENEFAETAEHCALAWDSESKGDYSDFLQQGFTLIEDITLTLDRLIPPRPSSIPLQIRTLASDSDWQAVTDLQLACSEEMENSPGYRLFQERLFQNYRKMQEAGHGHWWGAFNGNTLVGDMGLFFDASREFARFQCVETHPDYRRKGICSQLLSHIVSTTLDTEAPKHFVICTEKMGAARNVYESLGFKYHSKFYGLQKEEK